MFKSLEIDLKRLRGQPVEVDTDDHRRVFGRVLNVYDDAVRLIDDCGRIVLVELCHIDRLVEPQMVLRRYCDRRRDNGDGIEEDWD